MEFVNHFLADYGYLAIFSLLVIGIAGPWIPDDWILFFTGLAIHRGQLHPVMAVCAAYGGSLGGITLSYAMGRTGLILVLERFAVFRSLTAKHMPRVHAWFERYGKWTLFFGYFFAGIRHFTALTAGLTKLEYRTFATWAYPGGLVWVISFISAGYYASAGWEQIHERFSRGALVAAVVVIVVSAALWLLHRSRRARS